MSNVTPMTKYPRYPNYKNSGVKMLGEVPTAWVVGKLGFRSKLQGGYAFASSSFQARGIPVVRMNNIKRGKLDLSDAAYVSETESKREFSLASGDLVWGMSGSIGGTGSLGNFAIVSDADLPALLNQRVGRFVASKDSCDTKFLSYWIQTKSFYDQILLCVTGTAQFNVSSSVVESCILACPPLTTQRAIAAFLDRETARIDQLIEKKQRQLELLDEKRSALISHAVTKGLDPRAKMKPSGVEWLGDIPAHWKMTPVKRLASVTGRIGYRGYTTEDIVGPGEGAISLSPSNMVSGELRTESVTFISWEKYEESPEIAVESKDILIVKTGSTYSKVAFVDKVDHPSTINPQLAIIRAEQVLPKYLFYFLYSPSVHGFLRLLNTGSTIPTMTQESIGQLGVPVPPRIEQEMIVKLLDRVSTQMNAVVEMIKASIKLLEEHRAALISAAVTGKIDVREAA